MALSEKMTDYQYCSLVISHINRVMKMERDAERWLRPYRPLALAALTHHRPRRALQCRSLAQSDGWMNANRIPLPHSSQVATIRFPYSLSNLLLKLIQRWTVWHNASQSWKSPWFERELMPKFPCIQGRWLAYLWQGSELLEAGNTTTYEK